MVAEVQREFQAEGKMHASSHEGSRSLNGIDFNVTWNESGEGGVPRASSVG